MRTSIATAGAWLLVTGCCPAVRPTTGHPVVAAARHAEESPLAGTIWDVAAGRAIDRGALVARLVAARFVLLGETHDNPKHHAWQAQLLAAMIAGGRRPAVAFEMIESDRQADVDAARQAHPDRASIIAHAVGWQDSGWPDFALYEPIFSAALRAELPILAANLPRDEVRALARQGLEGVTTERAAALGLDRPLPEPVEAALRQEMAESHCGMLPADHMGGMVLAQRARDAQMAAVLAGATGDGAVGIVGAGHARTDRGVPARLRELVPDATVASVGFVEADPSLPTPEAHAAVFGAERLPFDVVVFTVAQPREDPCAEFAHSRP